MLWRYKKRTYSEKSKELKEKYYEVICLISKANDVDLGVAYEMLKSNVRGDGNYPYIKLEEAKADFEELLNIAKAEVGE